MTLDGLPRSAVRPPGGIASVELIPASAIRDAVYDPSAGRFISLDTAGVFAEYVFREDSASYREETDTANGACLVRHTLTMEFPAGDAARKAVEQLARMSCEGFAAVITAASGERILAGYSLRFGNRFPLRLDAAAADSGNRRADFPTRTVVLKSEDTAYSLPLAD